MRAAAVGAGPGAHGAAPDLVELWCTTDPVVTGLIGTAIAVIGHARQQMGGSRYEGWYRIR